MNYKVSIIVPIYNVQKYIYKCIDSILSQTYKNLEIILVDDGSPDNCGKICDEYASKDNRIIVVHTKNGGLSAARNVGLNKSTGNFIIFVDSDDYLENSAIEDCLNYIKTNNCDILIFNWYNVYLNNQLKIVKKIPQKINEYYSLSNKLLYDAILWDKVPNYVWNKIYKKQLWENISFPQNCNFEDLAIMPYIFSKAHNISYLDKHLYNYNNSNSSSITSHISSKNKYGLFLSFFYRQQIALKELNNELYAYSKIRTIKSAVTSWSLNTVDEKLNNEQRKSIIDYLQNENIDNLNLIGLKYKILYYSIFKAPLVNKIYAHTMFFLQNIKKHIKFPN